MRLRQAPEPARDLADIDDLVQVTLLGALEKVRNFEQRGEGTLLAATSLEKLHEAHVEMEFGYLEIEQALSTGERL